MLTACLIKSLYPLVAVNTESYQYTMGVDTDSIFLFCHAPDDSVRLSDIHWKRQDRVGFFPNPLDVHKLGNFLKHTNNHPMECFDAESDNTIMNVKLDVNGEIVIFQFCGITNFDTYLFHL